MHRDEEDQLFAQEMERSVRRFALAVGQQRVQANQALVTQCEASRARSRDLADTSALLKDNSLRLREESKQLRRGKPPKASTPRTKVTRSAR